MSALAQVFAWATVAVMGYFTVTIWSDPRSRLGQIMHDEGELPRALLVRYAGLTVLALLLAIIGNVAAITAMFAAYALIGLGDAWVYRSAGKPFLVHAFGGASAVIGTVVGLLALG